MTYNARGTARLPQQLVPINFVEHFRIRLARGDGDGVGVSYGSAWSRTHLDKIHAATSRPAAAHQEHLAKLGKRQRDPAPQDE